MDHNTCPSPPAPVNYKSDFTFYLDLYAITGYDDEGKPVLEPIGFPDYDWVAKFTTERMSVPFVASSKVGVLTNCRCDKGRILIVANKHNLCPGRLSVDFSADLPSDLYPDGTQLHALPSILDIELTRHAAPCPSAIEAKLILPYIKGEPFTFDDFTPEQLAEIKRPATEAAEAAGSAATKATSAAKAATEAAEVANTAAGRVDAAIKSANDCEAKIQAAEEKRQAAETKRIEAEQQRATTFDGWQDTLNDKQESLQDSAEITVSENNTLSLTERAKRAVFDDLWKAAVGSRGDVDQSHFDEDGRSTPYLCCEIWLTYEEATYIYSLGATTYENKLALYRSQTTCRTFLPSRIERYSVNGQLTYADCLSLEVVYAGGMFCPAEGTFLNCRKLRKILKIYSINAHVADQSWQNSIYKGCTSLESITFDAVYPFNFSLADCPLLDIATFRRIVTRYAGQEIITITVHPDVYAKLTDESNAEWHQVLLDAIAKNISFATV